MATGDPSNWAIVAAGTQLTVDLEGMSAAGISAFESGKTCVVAVASVDGYNGTTLVANKTRSARTLFNAATSLAATAVDDTFTEAGNTALASHTPDTNTTGNSWVERNGTWQVSASDYAQGTGSSPGGAGWLATIDCNSADVTITSDIRIASGFTSPGILLRWTDNSNLWMAVLEENTEKILLIKREAGSNSTVAEYTTAGLTTAATYTLVVEAIGTAIKVYWNGSEVISTTSSFSSTATHHGMRASVATNVFNSWQAVVGSGARVTLDLEDPIHTGETATATLTDEAFDDGVNLSNAATDAAVTNNSTLDYGVCVCGIVSKLPDRYTSAFYVDVYAVGPAYAGHLANFGVAAVQVTVTDSAGSPHSESVTATSMTNLAKVGSNGYQSQYAMWRVGPFDPADFTAGVASIVAIAHPTIGDAGSRRTSSTQYCYLDPLDAYDTQIANVDCSGTMALSVGLSANIGKHDRIVGGTSGAVAYVNQAYTLGATSPSVSYSSGTFTADEALSIKDAYADTETATATLSGSPTWTATDAGGTLGSSGTPYRTIIAACNACAAANTSSKGSWSEVRLKAGAWNNQALVAEACNTSDGPITITRHADAAAADVFIVRGTGLTINNIRFADLTLKPLYGNNYLLELGNAGNAGQGMDGGDDYEFVLDNVTVIGKGRTTAAYFGGVYTNQHTRYSWGSFHLSESNLSNLCSVQRDCTVEGISEDLMKSGTGHAFVINCEAELDASGTANHSDAFQFYTDLVDPDPVVNCGMHNTRIHGANHQNAPFSGGVAAVESITSFAMTNCVQEADGTSDKAQFGDNPWDSIFLYNNVSLDDTLFRNDTAAFTLTNAFIKRNVFASISTSAAPVVPHAGWGDNHFVSAATTRGFDLTSGGSTATLFVDHDNEDYEPISSLIARGWTDPIAPIDGHGQTLISVQYGYAGAWADALLLLTPADNATDQPTTTTFSWTAYPAADHYHLYYTPDGGAEVEVADIAGTSHQVSGLDPSTLYTWYVLAHNDSDEIIAIGESETWEFTTGDAASLGGGSEIHSSRAPHFAYMSNLLPHR